MSDSPESFDAEYVKKLRQEAGNYRQQVRDLESQLSEYSTLEAQITQTRVENELIRRGVTADPSWIPVAENQNPAEAVDAFLQKWPQLAHPQPNTAPQEEQRQVRPTPAPMPPNPNKANVPGPQARGSFGDRALNEIKQDPVARENLRQIYREAIRASSHQSGD